MMRFEREKVDQPEWLVEKWQKWGKQATQVRNKGKEVYWYTHKKAKVNQLLTPLLRSISENHCAFCDGYPMQQMTEQIEHFRPKSIFPELSHQWENLFPCCQKCNEHKLEEFDELLLKPDALEYSFTHYFSLRDDGVLEPDIRLSEEEKRRVEKTIELYGLNEYSRPEARIDELKKSNSDKTGLYRFLYL